MKIFFNHSIIITSNIQIFNIIIKCQSLKTSKSFENHCFYIDLPSKMTNDNKVISIADIYLKKNAQTLKSDIFVKRE